MDMKSFPKFYEVASLPNLLDNESKVSTDTQSKPKKLTFYLSPVLAERLDLVTRAKAISKSEFVAQLVEKELSTPAALELEKKIKALFDNI